MILRSTADRPVHCSQKNASKITERIPASAYSGVARAQIVSLYTKTDVTDYFLKKYIYKSSFTIKTHSKSVKCVLQQGTQYMYAHVQFFIENIQRRDQSDQSLLRVFTTV